MATVTKALDVGTGDHQNSAYPVRELALTNHQRQDLLIGASHRIQRKPTAKASLACADARTHYEFPGSTITYHQIYSFTRYLRFVYFTRHHWYSPCLLSRLLSTPDTVKNLLSTAACSSFDGDWVHQSCSCRDKYATAQLFQRPRSFVV